MCGIAGFISLDGPRRSEWLTALGSRMIGKLRHRGPDGDGVYVSRDATVMFASTRLAVQDLTESARQPMTSPDEAVTIVFNGELYRNRGAPGSAWPSSTTSDTESFLRIVHGTTDPVACLAPLDAMFAVGWHDGRHRRVVLARDHFGIKPLLYAIVDSGVLFASEALALFQSGLIRARWDALAFLHRAYIRLDATGSWYRGVHALGPAEAMVIEDGSLKRETYWTPATAEKIVTTEAVSQAFRDAVTLRLPSDVPRAVKLSGGFDSSACFGLLTELGCDVQPFSVRYDGRGLDQNDDIPYAVEVAERAGRSPVMCDIGVDDLCDLMGAVVARVQRPFLDAETAMYRTYQRISEHERVVVYSGYGADELWGYQDGRYFPVVSPQFRADMHSSYYLRTLYYRRAWPSWHSMVRGLARQLDVPEVDIEELVWADTWEPYRGFETLDPYKRGRYHLMRRFLVNVNETIDALAAGFSLEDRPLFEDVTLAEMALCLPEYVKNREGVTSFKPFLKQALRRWVPESVVHREKQGFPCPDDLVYKEKLCFFLREHGLPFDVVFSPQEFDLLGIQELTFLCSARLWLSNMSSG